MSDSAPAASDPAASDPAASDPAGPDPAGPDPAGPDPDRPDPDGKDWTWTTIRACPECGFDPTAVAVADLPALLLDTTPRWQAVLQRRTVVDRPAPTVWSPLEYACHVRDVHDLFAHRAQSMLDQDSPRFANWDQDATAVAERYWDQDPASVAAELATSGAAGAAVFDSVDRADWSREGFRSNGSVFSVESIGRYYLHDVLHHLHDVQG